MDSCIIEKFKNCLFNKCNIDINSSDKIILAVSGGADSVCMLILFSELFDSKRLVCAHFNHKIRLNDAESDAKFTKLLSDSLNVKFEYSEENIPDYAKVNGFGLEEAARICRYRFLKNLAKKYGENTLISVAHNKNDRVETILHNISRGSSIDGLKGIEYRKGNIIRPLLDLSRIEIEEICKSKNIKPVYDITNSDNNYKRNKIRNVILPFLNSAFGDDFTEHIIKLSDSAVADSNYLSKKTCEAYVKCCKEESHPFDKIILDKNLFFQLDESIRNRLLRLILSKVCDINKKNIFPEYTGIYSDMILRVNSFLSNCDAGKYTEIGSGVVCVSSYGNCYFTHKSFFDVNYIKGRIDIETKSVDAFVKDRNVLSEVFDFDKLEKVYGKDFLSDIKVNKYSKGDVLFSPFGMKGHKTLRKFLIDNKIGTFERAFVEYVSIGADILWIPGIRRSNIAPIDKNTSRVIIIKYVSD